MMTDKVIYNMAYRLKTMLAACLLAGCTADGGHDAGDGLVPITLKAAVKAMRSAAGSGTRAAAAVQSARLDADEPFRVVFDGGATTDDNLIYLADGADGCRRQDGQAGPYFTFDGKWTDVYAYHPSAYTGDSETTFSVMTDQTTEDNYKASDLMYATTRLVKRGSSVSCRLEFEHLMAKVLIDITPTGVGNIRRVSLVGGHRTVSLTSARTCTLGNEYSDGLHENPIVLYEGNVEGTVSCAGLIPPQGISANFVKVETDIGTAVFSLINKTFEGGHVYHLMLGVNAIAVSMSPILLNNWNDAWTLDLVNNGNGQAVTDNIRAIDMGITLPDGHGGTYNVLWANMNIGATTPTDLGHYFAWGDPAAGTAFGWSTYKWHYGSYNETAPKFTKYVRTANTANWYSATGASPDNLSVLQRADDAAVVNWGNGWRMPTEAEVKALIATYTDTEHYEWLWCDGVTTKFNNTTVPGVEIRRLVGVSHVSLFLPAAGNMAGNGHVNQGTCKYWAASLLNDVSTSGFTIDVSPVASAVGGCTPKAGSLNRFNYLTVRPVKVGE